MKLQFLFRLGHSHPYGGYLATNQAGRYLWDKDNFREIKMIFFISLSTWNLHPALLKKFIANLFCV